MGNQLTGIAPSQIQPVEQYLTEVPDCQYDGSLGSTRFFKVARAKGKEGHMVVKVFVIHDPSLPLSTHKDKLEDIRVRLQGASNCLPFGMAMHSDKAALLFRQFVKDSLYDRISTRPFLNLVEKKWIAFQLLCALNQCHKLKVYHGDIKSENVMITSWNWVLLTDFASFKPTYIPEDNPSDFNYFFDTSRRRTCYIAPERFVETGLKNLEVTGQTSHLDITGSEVKKGELTPAMDIFSTGCVIAELFTEGTTPFDLSQLLAYRSGEYSPWKVLEKIEDVPMRDLIRHMMQREPSHRLSAEEYLIQQRGKLFPEYFYTFLKLHLQRFAMTPITPPDDRIGRIWRDIGNTMTCMNMDADRPEKNAGLVLIISLVASCVRRLHYCSTKLVALELMLDLSNHVTADIILDRLLPHMLYFVNDRFPRVRAAALRTITKCLAGLKTVPRSDANIFPEYILPNLTHLTQDPVALVRVAYAENIAQLAETALSVLEMMHIQELSAEEGTADDPLTTPQFQTNYDVELQTLQEMVQQKVVTLLSDPDNMVKQTLLESGITRLCVFFGRQKANDILLSHMITFLNDKLDWHLRSSFFENIVGVAAYVGWQSSTIMKPLLQQGLNDPEEFVVHKALGTLTSLTQLSLLQKPLLYDFVKEVVPLLAHPGVWIRQGAAGFISAVARLLNIADVHCRLLPQIQPFLKQPVLQLDKEVVLLNSLCAPIARPIFDYVLRSPNIERLFGALADRSRMRQISRHGHRPSYDEMDEGMAVVFRKLMSQGLTEDQEDRLLALKDFTLKIYRARAGSAESKTESHTEDRNGAVDLYTLSKVTARRHADMHKPKEPSVRRKKKTDGVDATAASMNAEWKSMFGSSPQGNAERALSPSPKSRNQGGEKPLKEAPSVAVTGSSMSILSASTSSVEMIKRQASSVDKGGPQTRYANCKLELRNLVYKRREQYAADVLSKDLLEGIAWDSRPPPTNWRPKGTLVAHMQEHRAAVNRIQVSGDHTCFATCSNDGTVKVWDCHRFEGKSVSNRARQTYNKQGGQVKCLTYCEGSTSIASASDNGSIHVFRIETGSNTCKLVSTDTFDIGIADNGHVADLTHFDTGAQSVLAAATVNGYLLGWDLRARSQPIWKLSNDPKAGVITSFAVHHTQSWLCVGTSSGAQVCWDMRFHLPITTVNHPTGAWVRRVAIHPREQSWVISSVQGNNEVSVWELETATRQKTLWASPTPPLGQQMSNHCVQGMYVGNTDSNVFLLTGGTDMRVRYWDLTSPQNSFVMAGAANDSYSPSDIKYRLKVIDGTEVIQEVYTRPTSVSDDIPRRAPESPSPGHHDTISDVAFCQVTQCFVISASRDGVVKVWK